MIMRNLVIRFPAFLFKLHLSIFVVHLLCRNPSDPTSGFTLPKSNEDDDDFNDKVKLSFLNLICLYRNVFLWHFLLKFCSGSPLVILLTTVDNSQLMRKRLFPKTVTRD